MRLPHPTEPITPKPLRAPAAGLVTPSLEIADAVAELVREVGSKAAAAQIGIGREVVCRVAARLGSRKGSLALVERWYAARPIISEGPNHAA